MAFHKDKIPNTLKAFVPSVILGFSVGLVIAVLYVIDNRLIYYKLYNLILFEVRTIVTDYIIVLALFTLVLLVLYRLLKGVMRIGILMRFDAGDTENNLPFAVTVSLVLYVVLALICYMQFPNILEFIKNTPIAEPLRTIGKSLTYTYLAFFILFFVTAVSFTSVLTYLLVRLRFVGTAHMRLSAVTNSRPAQLLGLFIFGTVVIYNAAVLGYKELKKPRGHNIVLITIDTLRADHLGAYGYERNTSPNIDKLAEKSVLFENAYSQAPWTLPSMASMHTSLYPAETWSDYKKSKTKG